jgi:aminoglycoside phosphotransferase (APT) family kinase protein
VPDSLTKRRVDEAILHALIHDAFGPDAAIARSVELTDGFFNVAFRVLLADGRDVVLKASPTPDTPLLFYERDLMRAEAEFFRAARVAGVPLPELLHEGFNRTLIDGDFLVLSALDGIAWSSVRDELGETRNAALRHELGGIAARLHAVTRPDGRFGYPAAPDLTATTWPGAFAVMLDALIDDAVRYGTALPVPAAELRRVAERHADALAEVTVPSLVHMDLWPGNVFVTNRSRVSGLIDGERMVWGDPLLEFVGMDVFGRADRDEAVTAGYLAAGGRIDRGDGARRRLTLYYLYMQLLLLTEMGPRGYTDPDYIEFCGRECPARVRAALAELA